MIPLIFGAAALASATVGALAGAGGIADMKKAQEIGKYAQWRHEGAVRELQADWVATNQIAQEYGQLQLDVKQYTIGRFVSFIKRISQRTSQQSSIKVLAGLKISAKQFKAYKAAVLEAEKFFKGSATTALAGATAGGVTAGQGVLALVGLFGTASTGTAISGLSGAAAWNATLAWLGGGSLAAGGGGMALGTLVLGGVMVGPALMVGGFMIAGKGQEALTKAREYEAKVNTAVATITAERDFLQQVQQRITQLANLVKDLNRRAVLSLDELESRPFAPDRDTSKLQHVALLIKALEKIGKTPVLDRRGKLNPATTTLLHPEFIKRLEEEQGKIQIAQRRGKLLLAVLMILGVVGSVVGFKSSQQPQITVKALNKIVPNQNSTQPGIKTSEQASTNLIAAQKLGLEAAKMVQNPPHPLTVWQQAQAKWQEAINLLEAIPEGTSVSAQSKEKLAAYRANYAAISKRLIIEQKASVNLETAQKVAMEASIIVQYPPYPAEVWQQAQAKWQQAINLLEAIPEGTFVSAQAKEKLAVYRNNYAAVSQRAF
jgi:hypothetical protein